MMSNTRLHMYILWTGKNTWLSTSIASHASQGFCSKIFYKFTLRNSQVQNALVLTPVTMLYNRSPKKFSPV